MSEEALQSCLPERKTLMNIKRSFLIERMIKVIELDWEIPKHESCDMPDFDTETNLWYDWFYKAYLLPIEESHE